MTLVAQSTVGTQGKERCCGKRENNVEEPVSKHVRPGTGRREDRHGKGRLNPTRETRPQSKNGGKEYRSRVIVKTTMKEKVTSK